MDDWVSYRTVLYYKKNSIMSASRYIFFCYKEETVGEYVNCEVERDVPFIFVFCRDEFTNFRDEIEP